MNFFVRLKQWLLFRWGISVIHRKMRKGLRSRGLRIYTTKFKAIQKAKSFTHMERRVYWVIKEDVGYYVVHLDDIDRLNSSSMKQKGGEKIRVKYLNNTCVWRSPKYSTL